MTLKEIEDRIKGMVHQEMEHLREMGFPGDLRAAAEKNIGDDFWRVGLRWNRTRLEDQC